MTKIRNKSWGVAAAGVLLSITLTAAPAHADGLESDSDPSCWVNADTDVTQCFDSAADLTAAVLTQTGGVLVRQSSAEASPLGARAVYVIADLYTDASYAGTTYNVTSSSNTICTTGTGKIGNLTGGANNTVSSFHSYLSCATTLYDLAGQTGTSYGPAANASSLGAMNDRASSYDIN